MSLLVQDRTTVPLPRKPSDESGSRGAILAVHRRIGRVSIRSVTGQLGELLQPLTFRHFRYIFIGLVVSGIGSWMMSVAAAFELFHLSGSCTLVGVLAVVSVGSGAVLSPLVAGWCVRRDPRRIAMFGATVAGTACLALAYLAWMDALQPTELLILVFIGTVGNVVASTAVQIVEPTTVPPAHQRRALGVVGAGYNVSRLVGGVTGGIVVGVLGAQLPFALNALSYVVLVAAVVAVPSAMTSAKRGDHKVLAGLAECATEIWRSASLRSSVVFFVAYFLLVAPIQWLLPTLTSDSGHAALAVGYMVGAIAVGALVASPLVGLVPRRHSDWMRAGALLASAVALLAIGSLHNMIGECLGLILVGMAWELCWTLTRCQIQFEAPTALSRPMLGIFIGLGCLAPALGSLAMGLGFDDFGAATTLIAAAAVLAITAAFGLFVAGRVRAPWVSPWRFAQ